MILLITLIFLIMLTAPLVYAGTYYKTKQGEILVINQSKVKDARYFGKMFAALIEKNLPKAQDNTIVLSRKEKYLSPETQEIPESNVQELVISLEEDFIVNKGLSFEKEIYGGGNLVFHANEPIVLRAAYSKKNIIVGDRVEVIRWLDSEGTLAIYDGCNLGISASSKLRMSIGYQCSFRRLFAPEIRLGQHPDNALDASDGKNPKIYNMPVEMNKEKNIRYITSDMINDQGVIDYSILSWENVTITENIIVQGDVRSHQGVRLGDNAVICGNVFAEKNVYLGKNACVLGNIFSQENIYFEENAVAGQRHRISSVVARGDIEFEKNNFVFGYIGCEGKGTVAKAQHFIEKKEVDFLLKYEEEGNLTFSSVNEYNNVDQQGYRFNAYIKEVWIPMQAKNIPKSMFYHCQNLTKVHIPNSIQFIGAYCFSKCNHLEWINLDQANALSEIGIAAFENCSKLKQINIPASVRTIGAAAFKGCHRLEVIAFDPKSELESLEDHCFNGCRSLREIRIPPQVKSIGVSCFLGCHALETIRLAKSLKDTVEIDDTLYDKVVYYEHDINEEYNENTNE